MKTTTANRRTFAPSGLALVAVGCLLAFEAQPPRAMAAAKQPTFSEIPGVTGPETNAAAPATPPAPTTAPRSVVVPPTPPPAPTTPAEEETKDKTLYSFQATDLDLKSALAAFARANNLNIVPDNDVAGIVTLDVRDLPLKQIMRALLEANDCSWN